MYQVDEVFKQVLFGKDRLAHPISGTRQTIGKMTVDDLKSFYQNNYQTGKMVLVIVSDEITLKKTAQEIEKYFQLSSGSVNGISASKVEKSGPRHRIINKPIQQGNLIVGFEGPSANSDDQIKMNLLSALLGGMMSSRLFLRIREQQGLCYYIKSHVDNHQTTGSVAAQAGMDPKNLIRTLEAILNEYQILKNELVDDEELGKTKEYMKGKLALALEDSEELASFYGHQWIMMNRIKNHQQIVREIDQVSAEDIRAVARKYFQTETLSVAIVAPSHDSQKIDKIIKNYK